MRIIFIVDDSDVNLRTVEMVLEKYYKVITLSSAYEMFEKLLDTLPDLIMLDIMMPEMNGFEAMKLLKENKRYRDIPVVFLTGRSDEEAEAEGFELGAVDFISKACSEPVLLNRIKTHLRVYDLIRETVKANEYNRTVFNTAPIGLTVFDEEYNLIDCNEVILEILGVEKDFYLHNLSQVMPVYQPDGSHSMEKAYEYMKCVLHGEVIKTEWMHHSPAGEPLPCEMTLTRIKQGDKYIGIGYFYDLRQIKEFEESLIEAEERSRLMLDASPLCCQLWDSDFNIIDCNEAAVSLFCLNSKEEHADRIYELTPEYQPDGQRSEVKFETYITRAFAEGRCTFEWTYQLLDGTALPVEVTLVRVKYKDRFVVVEYTKDMRIIKHLEEKAEERYFDALTGIYNRRYLYEKLNRLIRSLSRSGGYLSIMLIDVDCFKQYNDTYGHIEGDKILQQIAKIISQSASRNEDFAARYGGEEFIIILPYTDEKGARLIAEKLLTNVRNCRIPHKASDVMDYLTISIGVTTGRVKHIQNGDEYLRKTDEMLYVSKNNGRNQYSFKAL